ncbi:hypothetical protein HDK90DRAFT_468303 [Phyllosticta capitalensis]|uniref:Uncharacterized protein n=1 Tax=Phyllosticta capitalensis TaxID=121624 RepID=A0ABR1YFT5_9PEZI
MPSKRDADAAGLRGHRRNRRQRSQPDELHRSGAATTTVVDSGDELGKNDPRFNLGMPKPQKPIFPGRNIPKPTPETDEQRPPDYIKTYQYFTNGIRSLAGWNELRKDDEGKELSGKDKDHWILHNGDIIDKLCDPFFTFDIEMDQDATLKTLGQMDERAMKIIDEAAYINGRDDWYELFRDNESRKHLVYAMLGFVMKEFVFGSLCYGADHDQLRILHRDVDVTYCDEPYEGFIRTRIRGKKIAKLWATNPNYMHQRFIQQSKELAWQTYELLAPLLALHPDAAHHPPRPGDTTHSARRQHQQRLLRALFELLTRAGRLALHMRLDRHTVYRLLPPRKDAAHTAEDPHVLVLNDASARAANRFENETWPGMPERKQDRWRAAVRDAAFVRISAFPGIVAYKQGGWAERHKKWGLREAWIAPRVVAVRWGKESEEGEGGWESVWVAERWRERRERSEEEDSEEEEESEKSEEEEEKTQPPSPSDPSAIIPLDYALALLRAGEIPHPDVAMATALRKRFYQLALHRAKQLPRDMTDQQMLLDRDVMRWVRERVIRELERKRLRMEMEGGKKPDDEKEKKEEEGEQQPPPTPSPPPSTMPLDTIFAISRKETPFPSPSTTSPSTLTLMIDRLRASERGLRNLAAGPRSFPRPDPEMEAALRKRLFEVLQREGGPASKRDVVNRAWLVDELVDEMASLERRLGRCERDGRHSNNSASHIIAAVHNHIVDQVFYLGLQNNLQVLDDRSLAPTVLALSLDTAIGRRSQHSFLYR